MCACKIEREKMCVFKGVRERERVCVYACKRESVCIRVRECVKEWSDSESNTFMYVRKSINNI